MNDTYQRARPTATVEETRDATLECYLASIMALAECVEAACPAVGVHYYDQVMRIRRRLAFDSTPVTLEETRESLESTLMAYAEQAYRYCELRSKEREEISKVLGEIEEIARAKDVPIEGHIADIRKRLGSGQELSTVDPLTGLATRREIERQIKLRLATDKQFCVLFFDIDDFGMFNETLGREAGDGVLKQVGQHLNTQIRARDMACRWFADEFIVILECDMENARARSSQMSQFLRGPYTVEEEGREVEIEIRVSAATVECRPGDTPRQIWLRLEEDFHRQNRPAAVA